MTDNKKIFAACLQIDVKYGDLEANFAQVQDGLQAILPASPGIVALPELWEAGFAYSRLGDLVLQTPDILKQLQVLAKQHGIILAGSLPETDGVHYYNTLYFTGPAGTLGSYRKQRLFAPMREDGYFTAGTQGQAIATPLGKIAALVCYDLRFPELARKQSGQGAELLVISAQWPLVRKENWRVLVQARAIENQIFVVAANRYGTDPLGDQLTFAGHSMIVAPDGTILQEAGEGSAHLKCWIDMSEVQEIRKRFNTVAPAQAL